MSRWSADPDWYDETLAEARVVYHGHSDAGMLDYVRAAAASRRGGA